MDRCDDLDRVEEYLAGRASRDALTPEEREQAAAIDAGVDAARRFVLARPAPELTAAVRERIRQTRAPAAGGRRRAGPAPRTGWLWTARPVTLQWRPVYGLLAAAVVLAAVTPGAWRALGGVPTDPTASGSAPTYVQFRLEAIDARTVRLAGTFTQWQPRYELRQTAPGLWTVTLPLAPGVHDYAFVIDNDRWVPDPYAVQVADGFGGSNSRISLLPPGGL